MKYRCPRIIAKGQFSATLGCVCIRFIFEIHFLAQQHKGCIIISACGIPQHQTNTNCLKLWIQLLNMIVSYSHNLQLEIGKDSSLHHILSPLDGSEPNAASTTKKNSTISRNEMLWLKKNAKSDITSWFPYLNKPSPVNIKSRSTQFLLSEKASHAFSTTSLSCCGMGKSWFCSKHGQEGWQFPLSTKNIPSMKITKDNDDSWEFTLQYIQAKHHFEPAPNPSPCSHPGDRPQPFQPTEAPVKKATLGRTGLIPQVNKLKSQLWR